ncbi:WxcM-like domain-containing protein [Polynucleobacter paneuropaeus]|nr:WxcM-like domain-containing protein [Polynucleobacter paneuropaeus]
MGEGARLNIENIKWIQVSTHADERGSLSAIESNAAIPFEIKRIFYMHHIVIGADRGGHAHLETDQFAIALHGSVRVRVSDGINSKVFFLNSPSWGIYLPKLTWTDLYDFSDEAVCLVLASTHYDRSKSLRTWEEFLKARNLKNLSLPDRGAADVRHP